MRFIALLKMCRETCDLGFMQSGGGIGSKIALIDYWYRDQPVSMNSRCLAMAGAPKGDIDQRQKPSREKHLAS